MDTFKGYLKDTYNLSSYQVAQIFFLFKTLASEISKMVIMGILFHSHFTLYLFALFVMLFLRCSMGGLHFYTYAGCLATSILYLWLAVYILPLIPVETYLRLCLLLVSIFICNYIGPIISKYRPEVCKERISKCKRFVTLFIFLYALIMYIIPDNSYLYVGFWVIILHSLQLIIAKIRKKGDEKNDR